MILFSCYYSKQIIKLLLLLDPPMQIYLAMDEIVVGW